MPKEKAIDKLQDDQVIALSKFIHDQGRGWKDALDTAWTSGRYPGGVNVPALQRLRNSVGPSVVMTLRPAVVHDAANAVLAAREQADVPSNSVVAGE
jgi:hypothetical protein